MAAYWLVGNGPSMPASLHLVSGFSIGVNKIAGIKTWRPTHYVKVDYSPFDGESWKDEILPFIETDTPCLLWDAFRDGDNDFGISDGLGDRSNVTWIARCKHHGEPPTSKYRATEWHEPFCTAYNSLNIMAQWAVKLGATEIHLIGCDGKFTNGKDDHFMPYYEYVDAGYVERNNSHVLAAHQLIKANCPVPVYDHTPNGLGVLGG